MNGGDKIIRQTFRRAESFHAAVLDLQQALAGTRPEVALTVLRHAGDVIGAAGEVQSRGNERVVRNHEQAVALGSDPKACRLILEEAGDLQSTLGQIAHQFKLITVETGKARAGADP